MEVILRFWRWAVIVICILFIVLISLFFLFRNEVKSLVTLEILDNYPLYSMNYHGDYGFDEFLKVGATNDREIEAFVMKRLLKGIEIDLNISSAGCTAFTSYNTSGERIFARNFDFDYAPPLVLYTKPMNGYKSISTVNLAFAGYDEGNLPKPYNLNSFLALASPYLPFDGMNEKGVAIGLLAVPYAEPPTDENKVTLNTTTLIRLVLDKAASVEEAVELIDGYNYYFSGGVDCHYLISDQSGNSVIVEFLEGEVKVISNEMSYQIASNFIAYNDMNIGEGSTEFERYDHVEKILIINDFTVSESEAMNILEAVSIKNRTQWSVVYNQNTLDMMICVGEDYDEIFKFKLEK